jgi:hypothetical protein
MVDAIEIEKPDAREEKNNEQKMAGLARGNPNSESPSVHSTGF